MEAGFDPETFWSLTPRELWQRFSGAARRVEREGRLQMAAAWHVAALSRAKRLPRLSVFLSEKPKGRVQSVEEQVAMARAWTTAVNRKKRRR